MKITSYIRKVAENSGIPNGGRGRTDFPRSCLMSTPIRLKDGCQPPAARGLGYWKTGFRNGDFSKILYTPSTLRVVVGLDWVGGPRVETVGDWASLSPASPYNRD